MLVKSISQEIYDMEVSSVAYRERQMKIWNIFHEVCGKVSVSANVQKEMPINALVCFHTYYTVGETAYNDVIVNEDALKSWRQE